MNRLRKEIEDRIKRMVDAFAEDRIANDDYARSDLASETLSSFMDGIVMAAVVCGDARSGKPMIDFDRDALPRAVVLQIGRPKRAAGARGILREASDHLWWLLRAYQRLHQFVIAPKRSIC